jgi:hypothetical protein
MDGYWCPFEPEEWPVKELHDWLSIHIKRDRNVYLDPLSSPPISIGTLSEGKEAITRKLLKLKAPKYVNIMPDEIALTDSETLRLHPAGYSVRAFGISKLRISDGLGE